MPLLLGGGAIALLGGAVGFLLKSNSQYELAEREIDNAKQEDLWRSSNTKLYVGEGLVIAGVACAGVATWLYFRRRSERRNAIAVTPQWDGSAAGVVFSGRY